MNQEYTALLNLIQRSTGVSTDIIARKLHSTGLVYSSEKNTKDNKKSSESNTSKNTGNSSSSNDDGGDNNNKGDEGGEKMMSVLTKAVLWIATIYIFTLVLTMMLPQKNRPETSTRYVSWHEFVHHMLAAGEVKELIIRPDMDMVTVILHDGAVIKGRQYSATMFHMAVADSAKFEEKLRDVEKRLGIRDGVTVTYDRHLDIAPKIIITLLVATLLFSLLSRMKGMKSPISMDSFVSIT